MSAAKSEEKKMGLPASPPHESTWPAPEPAIPKKFARFVSPAMIPHDGTSTLDRMEKDVHF
jgi:hypothetical protein